MPSLDHEALVELFRNEPSMVLHLLDLVADVALPNTAARVLDSNLAQATPTEYRADLVVAVGEEARIIVEVQLGRDEAKRWSWPAYVSVLRQRDRCPVYLLVVTNHTSVSNWAGKPIDMGHPGFCLAPWVVGPGVLAGMENIPIDRPELAVLAVLLEGKRTAPDLARTAFAAARPDS